jgi:hypothetical protein
MSGLDRRRYTSNSACSIAEAAVVLGNICRKVVVVVVVVRAK